MSEHTHDNEPKVPAQRATPRTGGDEFDALGLPERGPVFEGVDAAAARTADVVPLYGSPDGNADGAQGRTGDERDRAGHFEVELDDEPQPGGALVQAPDGAPVEPAGLRPVVAANWRGWQNIKATVRDRAMVAGHVTAFHLLRTPWYAVHIAFWAVVGAFVLAGRQLRWWWLVEQTGLRQQAADNGDPAMWFKLHREVKATRMWRAVVLIGEVLAVALVVPALLLSVPTWAAVAALAIAAVGLAKAARPAGTRLVPAAVVTGRFRRVNPDIVLRAYYAAGLGHPERPEKQVTFGSTMSRDAAGTGSHVLIDLPYGKGFDDVRSARGAIASGLDVSINQVFITPDPTSHRRHQLFVADRDPLAIPAGPTPLLDGKPRDIWSEAPFGLDERGRQVGLLLMWISVLVGAQPRKGKTFATRLLALYAALDPYVVILLADGKMSPDWDKFRSVVHRAVFGTVPNKRDNDPVRHFVEMLREVKTHIQDVNEFLSTLSTAECPEGKITRELSRKYPQLRVWMLVLEEFQAYFELDDQSVNKEIAELLSFIMAVGPSAGVIILSSSQKPGGVGAGDVQRLFNRFRDNHAVRFALKCGNRNVSEAVLGSDAYSEGYDASSLPNGKAYRGVGILYGASDDTAVVRTYLADHGDAEVILAAARKHREAAGTLTGLAAGQTTVTAARDVLADVASVFTATEPGLHWEHIAARLATTLPEHYGDTTPEAVSAQLRGVGLPSVNVKVAGEVLRGLRRKDLDAAIASRPTH